ncbi:HPr family phosphocarrier protein [Ruminococcus sp. 5_1_39BFAA]|uniref:HPr family phosphocarrier protein n=1 Tax=Ruminococcus sp. 5_1_39BFAA TaxID=457412 RepID=UPI003561F6E0
MVSFHYVIKDKLGIHARPAGLLVREAAKLNSKITICKGAKSGDARKVFNVMALAVKENDEIVVNVEGDTEEADAEVMKAFFENNL